MSTKRQCHGSAASGPSANQMAMLCGLGGLIVAAGPLLATVYYARFVASGWFSRSLFLLPLMLIGAALHFSAQKRLKRGIKDGRWPSAAIETLRINLESSLWRAASWACLILFCVGIVEGGRCNSLGMAIFVLWQTINTLQEAVRRPNVSEPRLGLDWRRCPPLRSEHWGER